METIYLKAEKHVEVTSLELKVKDICQVYTKSKALMNKVQSMILCNLECEDGEKTIFSMMAVIRGIEKNLGQENIMLVNLGESDVIVHYIEEKTNNKIIELLKVAGVAAVTFMGAAFAIMAYNEDVNVSGVFAKIYKIFLGFEPTGPTILELTYSIGIAFGIIIFFNHFGKRKFTKDPTPMEVEMEKYEEDVCDTIIKVMSRKGESID